MEQLQKIARSLRAYQPELYPEDIQDEALDYKIDQINAEAGPWSDEQRNYAKALKSGFYLWNGSLDKSHNLSQNLHSGTGSYWHGLMHRMEGDYDNANYWFKRANNHPIFKELGKQVKSLLLTLDYVSVSNSDIVQLLKGMIESEVWQAQKLTDCIKLHLHVPAENSESTEEILRKIQKVEFIQLLEYCYERSFEGKLFDEE